MHYKLFPLSALTLALLASNAAAAGFGEISLTSRIGEPLRAEVPILGQEAGGIDTACFNLAPLPNSDLPVVTAGRVKLVKVGESYRLIITGSRPVADPLFAIRLRATCGIELQRDYVLMPQAPIATAEAALPPAAGRDDGRPPRPATGKVWQASDGETLEAIAAALEPDDRVQQRRMLGALRRANPEIDPDALLADGTAVNVPQRPKRPAAAGKPPPKRPRPLPPSARDPVPEPARNPPPAQAPTPAGGDRLVLGAPPADANPGEPAAPPGGSIQEVEQRILKMETTLHLLNRQVDTLNQALTVAAEALAVQQKLKAAQALQTVPAPLPPPPANPPRQPQSGNWLELLVSALLGGGITAFAVSFASRRREQASRQASLPPAAPPARVPAPAPQPAPLASDGDSLAAFPTSSPAAAGPIDTQPAPLAEADIGAPDPGEMSVDEGESALQLAEIMLSFGRLRDAADTLASYIEDTAPGRIEPWLMLLNLYRRGNMRPEFETLMARMRRRFNFRIPDWDQSQTPISGLKSLEDYPHIAHRLGQRWGTQACMDYLFELVSENREGQRMGFPLEVVEEIALLMRVHEDGYGCCRPQ